ncbi:hypothetical protein OH77DRAFT_1440820, partial [Trametes cingulata]
MVNVSARNKTKAESQATPSGPAKRARTSSDSDNSSRTASDLSSIGSGIISDAPSERNGDDLQNPQDATSMKSSTHGQSTDAVTLWRKPNDPIPEGLSDIPEYVTDNVVPRLERLVLFSEPDTNRYSLRCIPLDVMWGDAKKTPFRERYLCVNDKPIIVWMLGIARFCRLVDDSR